jgi:peptide methionine sulfoxide reductase MsrB
MTWNDMINFIKANPRPDRKVTKTKEEWKTLVTKDQFYVTCRQGVERPFIGKYCDLFVPGGYGFICCNTHPFDSTTKFDSKKGWPSFT